MLGKILLLGLAVWLLLTLLKQYRRNVDAPRSAPSKQEDMVCCAHCGIHIPSAESVKRDGKIYCCNEHSQQPPQ